MVDRAELVQVQQFGQLVGVDTFTFVSVFEQSIFSRIAHHQLGHMRFSKSYSHAAQVPSSKVTDKVPRNPAKNSRMVAAFVSRMDSMTNLPVESNTATEMVA